MEKLHAGMFEALDPETQELVKRVKTLVAINTVNATIETVGTQIAEFLANYMVGAKERPIPDDIYDVLKDFKELQTQVRWGLYDLGFALDMAPEAREKGISLAKYDSGLITHYHGDHELKRQTDEGFNRYPADYFAGIEKTLIEATNAEFDTGATEGCYYIFSDKPLVTTGMDKKITAAYEILKKIAAIRSRATDQGAFQPGIIKLYSSYRPPGTSAGSDKFGYDWHGALDFSVVGANAHWKGSAIDVASDNTVLSFKPNLRVAELRWSLLKNGANLQPQPGETWHFYDNGEAVQPWNEALWRSTFDVEGGLLSEKGQKRARPTMSNALGPAPGRALGFMPAAGAGGLGGAGVTAAVLGAAARGGSGGIAAAAGPGGAAGAGVNVSQYIDKVNITTHGGFSTDALMAALEEAAQQGTANVG